MVGEMKWARDAREEMIEATARWLLSMDMSKVVLSTYSV